MFRTVVRKVRPNPLDVLLKKGSKKRAKKVLIAWNRGLGDIALGLFAIVWRVREFLPDAEITFLIRENLQEGFQLLEGVKILVASEWERGKCYDVRQTLKELHKESSEFDLIIEKPDPTYWVNWQLGRLVPRLKWNPEWETLHQKFALPEGKTFIGVQPFAETNYGLWRNWSKEYWEEFFTACDAQKNSIVLLFGFSPQVSFDSHPSILDLRGKTKLFEMLSLIKNRCSCLVVPDSGVLSMMYYLDEAFPLKIVSLWGDRKHGILKQDVASPNPYLVHRPLIAPHRDMTLISPEMVLSQIFS